MPIIVSELIARFGADTNGLVAGVAASKAELKGLDAQAASTAAKVDTALGGVGSAAEGAATKTNLLTASLTRTRREIDNLAIGQGKIASVGMSVAAAASKGTVALAGLSLGSAKMAADFDQSMRNVDSIAKLTGTQFQQLSKDVLGLVHDPAIKQNAGNLADGLYDIYSSGFQGAKALEILRAAAVGATAGMTDTATSTRVLVGVLNSGIGGVKNASGAMDVLFQEVNLGQNTFEQLAQQIGPLLPLAAKAGISLQEVSAAMAALTINGTDAAEAATQLQGLISHLVGASGQAAKEMDQLGIKHGLTAVKAEGLTGALNNVIKATKGHQDALHDLFPEIRSYIGLLALTGDGGKRYSDFLGQMTHASDGQGAALEANKRQLAGVKAQYEQLFNVLQADLIPAGLKLLPVIRDMAPLLKDVAEDVVAVLDAFGKLPEPIQKAIILLGVAKAASSTLGISFAGLAGNGLKLVGGFNGVKMAGAGLLDTFGLMATEGTAAAAGLGLIGVAAVGLGLDILLIKKDWDLASDAYENYKRAAAGSAAADAGREALDKTADNKRNMIGEAAKIAYEQGEIMPGIRKLKSEIADLTAHGKLVNTDINGTKAYLPKTNPQTIQALHDKEKALAALQAAYAAQEVNRQKLLKAARAPGLEYSTKVLDAGPNGAKIASAALQTYMAGDYKAYVHHCQQLARTTVSASTSIFNDIWDRGKNASALTNLARFKAAGLAQPYTPGMQIEPGSLLYSQTLGHGSGHVQTIGPHGERLDQYGKNKFAPSDFQYYVSPDQPGATGGRYTMPAPAGIPEGASVKDMMQAQAKERGEAAKAAKQAQRELESEAKQAEEARKQQLKQAADYMGGLEKEVALYGKTGKAAEVSYDIAHHGLDFLTKAEQYHAVALAKSYDAAEKAAAITEKYTTATAANHDEAEALRKSVTLGNSATEAATLAYDHAHTDLTGYTAAQAAYLRMQWAITEALQEQADRAATLAETLDSLKSLQGEYSSKAADGLSGYATDQSKAASEIKKIVSEGQKKGLDENDPQIKTASAGILSAAIASDSEHASSIVQKWLEDLNAQAAEAKEKIAGSVNPATKAVDSFLKQNAGAIRELTAILGKDKAGGVVGNATTAITAAVNIDKASAAIDKYKQKAEAVNKTYREMAALSPFDAWKQSIQEYDKATGSVGGPFGDADLKKLYNYEQGLKDIQEVSSGLTDAVFNSISKAFAPGEGAADQKQFLSSLQSQRYSVGIQAANFDTSTGVPNPYTAQLNSIDSRIAQTQNKIKGMGLTLSGVFHTVFGGIIQEFDTMIAKIAEDALKADLQQALNSTLAKALGKPLGNDANAKLVAAEQAQLIAIQQNTAKMGDLVAALNASAQASIDAGAAAGSTTASSGGNPSGLFGALGSIAGLIPGGGALSGLFGVAGTVAGVLNKPSSSSAGLYQPGATSPAPAGTTSDGSFSYAPSDAAVASNVINFNIQTPDASSFLQSRGQVAQQIGAASARAQARNGK